MIKRCLAPARIYTSYIDCAKSTEEIGQFFLGTEATLSLSLCSSSGHVFQRIYIALLRYTVSRRILFYRSALMRMRIHVLALLVRPGALGSPQRRKMSGTSIKSFHEMKGNRDGKSKKWSGTRYCL